MARHYGIGLLLLVLVPAFWASPARLDASGRADPTPLLCPQPMGGPCAELPETAHDFGRVRMGQVYEHEFKVGNPGGDTLVIENVKVG